jgi:hypothetical protein
MPHNKEMEPTAQKTRRGSFPGVRQSVGKFFGWGAGGFTDGAARIAGSA